jgi:predicted DNA-binding transcriptional regulator YafY
VQRDLNEKLDFLELEVQNGSYRVAASKLGLLSLQDITRFAEIAGLEGLYPQLNDALIRRWLQTSYQNALLVRGPSYEDLSGHENTFNLLQQAIDRCCTVGFRYLKTDGPKVTQSLKPYQLINHEGIWYLAAVDQDKLKCYTLTKIEAPFANTDERFEQDPTIVKTLEEEDSIWLNLSKTEVVIKVAAEVATYFKQRKLIAGQKTIKELEDGGLILSGQIAHPNQIWPTVRAWIPHVRIISPESLQADMELQLKAYLNLA